MPDDFLIARNPEADSALPFLVRIPLGASGIVLKAKGTWPRTTKIYCHRTSGWPDEPDIIERIPTRSCTRRGAAIELVLDRRRESRSQFVLTYARGREAIFWQSARTTKQARPRVRVPTARAGGPHQSEPLEILIDSHERYAWKFATQQVTTRSQPLAAGDYGVELDGRLVAAVERKSLADLTASLLNGSLRFALTELDQLPRAAVVVEERYSRVFGSAYSQPAVLADAIGECQARYPRVPIIFAENRKLAQEWTYRFLAAASRELADDAIALLRIAELPVAGASAPPAEQPDHAK